MPRTLDRSGQKESPSEARQRSIIAAQMDEMTRGGRSFSGSERKCVFLNTSGSAEAKGRFACVSAASGLDYPDDGRAIALVDWDQDGNLDLWMTNRTSPRLRFLRNNGEAGKHFVAMLLQGNGTTCNRDAIGARVEVVMREAPAGAGGRRIQTRRAGEGFLAQSSKWLHFGLAAGDSIERVVVRWPGGDTEAFTGIAAGQRAVLVQGSGRSRTERPSQRQLALSPAEQKVPETSNQSNIRFVTPVVVPQLPLLGFDGQAGQLPRGNSKFLLVNLWASWCQPCLVELREFAKRKKELQTAGIDILALSVDGLHGLNSTATEAETVVKRLSLPFATARATPVLLTELLNINKILMSIHHPLQLPSSFLLDDQGRLVAMYVGPVSAGQLLVDTANTGGTIEEQFARAAPLPGRVIQHDVLHRAMLDDRTEVHARAGLYYASLEAIDDAVVELSETLAGRPDWSQVRLKLATLLLARGRLDEAAAQSREAVRIDPSLAEGYVVLGNIAQRAGNAADAESQYKEAIRVNVRCAPAYNNLAQLAEQRRDFVAAAANYNHALRADPTHSGAHVGLSGILFQQGRFAEAETHCQQALAVDPNYAGAHANLGSILFKQGRVEEALKHYNRAAALTPNNAQVQYNLGIVFERRREWTQATLHFKKGLALARAQGLAQLVQRCEAKLIAGGPAEPRP